MNDILKENKNKWPDIPRHVLSDVFRTCLESHWSAMHSVAVPASFRVHFLQFSGQPERKTSFCQIGNQCTSSQKVAGYGLVHIS